MKIRNLILAVLIYLGLGSIALYLTIASVDLIATMKGMESNFFQATLESNPSSYMPALSQALIESVPLGEFLNELSGDEAGVIPDLVEFIYQIYETSENNIKNTWQSYSPSLLRDISVSALSSLILFCFRRINGIFYDNSKTVMFALAAVAIIWLIASYSFADCFLCYLEITIHPQTISVLYIIVSIVAFGIHSVLLTYNHSGILKSIAFLGVAIIFDVIRSILAWVSLCYIPGLYQIIHVREAAPALIVIALILCVIENIEDSSLKGLFGILSRQK